MFPYVLLFFILSGFPKIPVMVVFCFSDVLPDVLLWLGLLSCDFIFLLILTFFPDLLFNMDE